MPIGKILSYPFTNPKETLRGAFGGALGLALAAQLLSPLTNAVKSKLSYDAMLKKNPQLEGKDEQQIKDYFQVIKTFSPKAASNPLVAGALVNKMMEFGGTDHKLVQDLVSIQSGTAPDFNPLHDITSAAAKSMVSGDGGDKVTNIYSTVNPYITLGPEANG